MYSKPRESKEIQVMSPSNTATWRCFTTPETSASNNSKAFPADDPRGGLREDFQSLSGFQYQSLGELKGRKDASPRQSKANHCSLHMQCSSRKGRESASLKAETARLRGQNRSQGGEGGAKARDNKACAKATEKVSSKSQAYYHKRNTALDDFTNYMHRSITN